MGSIETVVVEWKRSGHREIPGGKQSRETDSMWDVNSERCRKRSTFGRSEFQLYCFRGAGDGLDGGFFPGGSDSEESAYIAGDLDSIPGLEKSPGGGHGNPFQYSCLENPHGQRSLAGYNPWVSERVRHD